MYDKLTVFLVKLMPNWRAIARNDSEMVRNDSKMVRTGVEMVRNDSEVVRTGVELVRNDSEMVRTGVLMVRNDSEMIKDRSKLVQDAVRCGVLCVVVERHLIIRRGKMLGERRM